MDQPDASSVSSASIANPNSGANPARSVIDNYRTLPTIT
jgi:hypothetical protein